MQMKISCQFVCGSYGACLDYMLPGVQVIAGLNFLRSASLDVKIVTPYSIGLAFHTVRKVGIGISYNHI